MQIIQSQHTGIFYKCYNYKGENFCSISSLWGFELDSGAPVLEQDIWLSIAELINKHDIFDMGMPKSNGEALIHGSFFGRGGTVVKGGKVSLKIADVQKELLVQGNRFWRRGIGVPSDPEPFHELPIGYANAFGGEGFPQNPIGKGFAAVETDEGKFHPLPNIEYEEQSILSPRDRPTPASFSKLDILWELRYSKAGTYDEKYLEENLFGFPDDIDWTYFNDSMPDQWIDGYFKGDESYEITNMNPEYPLLAGRLPGVYARFFILRKNGGQVLFEEIETVLDTVWFFPTNRLGVLIHRGVAGISEDDAEDMDCIMAAHENLADTPRPLDHYENEMVKRRNPKDAYKYIFDTKPLIPGGYRCGFSTDDEESRFPLEMLDRKNMAEYGKIKKKEAIEIFNQRRDEVVAKLERDGIDPKPFMDGFNLYETVDSPEAQKIQLILEKIQPGITGDDPSNLDLDKLDLDGFDELEEYLDQLTDESKNEAEKKFKNELDRLKAKAGENPALDQMIAQLETSMNEDASEPPMLPRMNTKKLLLHAKDQIDKANAQLAMMQSMGASESQLLEFGGSLPDLNELEKQVRESEKSFQDGYRQGAHYMPDARSPHPGKEDKIAEDLINAYQRAGETAGGDYAFVDLSNQHLSGINLESAYLEYANFTNANLRGANLTNAVLCHANLTGADLTGAQLSGANLGASIIESTNFSDADLRGCIFGKAHISNTCFQRCRFNSAPDTFLEAVFSNVDFSGAELSKNTFIDMDFSECLFSGANLSESLFLNPKLQGSKFNGAVLTAVNFIEAVADRSDFSNATMNNVRFVGGCILNEANFIGVDVSGGYLGECSFVNTDFSASRCFKTNFDRSDLSRSQFVKAEAMEASFARAVLNQANFYRANLMEGSLHKASLIETDFSGANLYSVNLIKSVVEETIFRDAILDMTILRSS